MKDRIGKLLEGYDSGGDKREACRCMKELAHGCNVEERNFECRYISHSLFSKIWNLYSRPAHMTIWLGDLNYRLEGINTHPARNLIDQDLHQKLHGNDQLLQQAGEGHIFNGCCEGTLTFKPTYKYNKGNYYIFQIKPSLHFTQWDPRGYSLFFLLEESTINGKLFIRMRTRGEVHQRWRRLM